MSILSKQSVSQSAADRAKHHLEDDICGAANDHSTHSKWVAVQVNKMPADIAIKQTVALTNTVFSPGAQTTSCPSPEQQQQMLQILCAHPLLYSGDLIGAAQAITATMATMLNLDRASLWQLADRELRLVNSYDRNRDQHSQERTLSKTVCDDYLSGINIDSAKAPVLADRVDLTIEDVAAAISSREPSPLNCLVENSLIHCAPGAFLEVVIRAQGRAVGVLWGERAQSYCWGASEKTIMLSVSLLAATAMDSVTQTVLSSALDKQKLQLKRETIEREQAEQAWQESQRFIQGILDASTNILYVDNFADGRNIYISRWIMNVLGYEAQDIQKLGAGYLEKLVHADEKELMSSERRKLSAINDGEVVENEYRFRHRQGNWRWLLCRETVFQRDEDGQPTQVFGTATDITKRKHTEMALQDLNRDLKRLASMDGLTQVANRRSFDSYLKQEWQNVGSGRSSLSLILCDIDYFKSFNDTYGHQAGDVCLRRVAQSIAQAAKRSTDLVARYGGEEFAVILPSTDMKGVQQVAKTIQQEIQQLDIPHSQSGVSRCITLSLGIAVVSSTENGHPDMLVAAADQGLYQAKYEGRDRYCVGTLEIPQPKF